ncbi:Putative ankyrin repeat-containing protein [Candidatus Megaera polyxenophila]|nr:Putative ankyrin repeat-containing protein [Candidatus Megaera polyxenophila]
MLNKSSDSEKYLPHIESALEVMTLGASATIREGVGIDINKIITSQKDETNGHTALTYCVFKQSTNAVRALVDEAGADPNTQSKKFGLPLSMALLNLSFGMDAAEKEKITQTPSSQMAHTLISRGADINQELISTSKVKTPEYVRLQTEEKKLRGEIEGCKVAQKKIIIPKEKELMQLIEKGLREAEKELAKASELEKSEAQKKVDGIKGKIQRTKEEIENLKQSEKFLDLENQITRTKGFLKDNLRTTKALIQKGKDFHITETRMTIVDNLKRNRPRDGDQKDPVFVLCGMLSDFQTKQQALDEQLKIVEESASKISSSSPFKVVKAHRHLCKAAARTSEKLLDEMLKESRVHLEPLLEKVQKIKSEADRAKELREEIGHVVGLGGRIMNKSITPEVAARARGIGDSIIPTTRPRSPITPPRISEKPTSSLKR